MKTFHLASTLLFLCFLISSCGSKEPTGPEAINVPQEKKSIFFEYTGTWCGPCGSWGNDAFHQAISLNEANIVPFSIHLSDGMSNDFSNTLKLNFPYSAVPNFYFENQDRGVSSNITGLISQSAEEPIVAGIGFRVEENELDYTIEAKVEFFEDSGDDFFVGFYAIESGLPGHDGAPNSPINNLQMDQDGDNSSDYTHDFVLRGISAEGVWGEAINTSSVKSNETFIVNGIIEKNEHWINENVEIIAIIWNQQSLNVGENQYEFENASNTPE